MTKLKILTLGNPILKKKSKAIKKITPDIKKLIKDMTETLHAAPGVGLAAPQVGQSVRLILVDVGEGLTVLINPKLTKKSGKQEMIEGCLSLPGLRAPIERYAHIFVEGLNRSGEKVKIEAHGLFSTVIQHEMDHLDGILCIDRVKDPSTIIFEPFEISSKEPNL